MDQSHIRECLTCPNCLGSKDRGLIVCWPCHGLQKAHNDGGYSARLERRLEEIERFLTVEIAARQRS